MTSYPIQCVEWSQEPSFGMVAASSKAPDMSLGTWVSVLAEQADFIGDLAEPGAPLELVRTDTHRYADDYVSVVNRTAGALWGASPGERVQNWRGRIRLRVPAYTPGPNGPYLLYWLHQMLTTSMDVSAPTVETDLVAGIGTSTTFTATAPGDYEIGRGFAVTINNATEYAIVTDIAGAVITYSPSTSRALQIGERIRHCQTLYRALGTSLATGALRFNYNGRRYAAFGCRVAELDLTFQEGAAYLDLLFDSAVTLRDDSGATLTSWSEPGGSLVQFGQGAHVLSNTVIGSTVPAALARGPLSLHSWSAKWTFGLGSVGGGKDSILGRSQTEITDSQLEVTVEAEPSSTLDHMYRKREQRLLALGAGHIGDGAAFDAHGFGLVVPAAHMTGGAGFGKKEGRHALTCVFRPGMWALDDATGAAARSPWRWLWPV